MAASSENIQIRNKTVSSTSRRASKYNPLTQENEHEALITKETKWPWIEFAVGLGLSFLGILLIMIGVSTQKRNDLQTHSSMQPLTGVGIASLIIGFILFIVFSVHYSIIRKQIRERRQSEYIKSGIRASSQYTVYDEEQLSKEESDRQKYPSLQSPQQLPPVNTGISIISQENQRYASNGQLNNTTFHENRAFRIEDEGKWSHQDSRTHMYDKSQDNKSHSYANNEGYASSKTSGLGSSPTMSFSTEKLPQEEQKLPGNTAAHGQSKLSNNISTYEQPHTNSKSYMAATNSSRYQAPARNPTMTQTNFKEPETDRYFNDRPKPPMNNRDHVIHDSTPAPRHIQHSDQLRSGRDPTYDRQTYRHTAVSDHQETTRGHPVDKANRYGPQETQKDPRHVHNSHAMQSSASAGYRSSQI